ncbi:hypothetical protein PMAYCL1PPCAC_13380, partial [Pristionchus mayeri]
IVVGPPEGILRDASPRRAHDARPVVIVRVDSQAHSHRIALCNHVEDELTVRILIRSPVVDLDVEPEHSESGSSIAQSIHCVRDLGLCGSAAGRMAREDVCVHGAQSCTPCVLDVLDA